MNIALLNQFEPNADELLRSISARIVNRDLWTIAAADYGEESEAHFKALVAIRDNAEFPTPYSWVPAEVLELIRWSEPEIEGWKPGEAGETGHWLRAFSCAALLRAYRAPWNWELEVGVESTIAQLVMSLFALPIDYSREGRKFLSWFAIHGRHEEEQELHILVGVALLALVPKNAGVYPGQVLEELANELVDECSPSNPRLMLERCQKRNAWFRIAKKLELLAKQHSTSTSRAILDLKELIFN